MERLQKRYKTSNGDIWEEWLVIYDTDRYIKGGRDEILQYKKNGYEVGHITYHLDSQGTVSYTHLDVYKRQPLATGRVRSSIVAARTKRS